MKPRSTEVEEECGCYFVSVMKERVDSCSGLGSITYVVIPVVMTSSCVNCNKNRVSVTIVASTAYRTIIFDSSNNY